MMQSVISYFPQIVCASFQGESKVSDQGSSNSSNGRRNPFEDFIDLPERDKGNIVGGAFFVLSVLVIAIIYFRRNYS
jgi:hypothetical protein